MKAILLILCLSVTTVFAADDSKNLLSHDTDKNHVSCIFEDNESQKANYTLHKSFRNNIGHTPKISAINGKSNIFCYYGEISSTTGRAKTNYVNGYSKSNGTYVRGYYRS